MQKTRNAASPGETGAKTKEYLEATKQLRRTIPVHYQEPFLRGYNREWNPLAADFVRDALAARDAGAAGWCFHNGDEPVATADKRRRSFDLRERRLFEQLDSEELKAIAGLRKEFAK